MKRAISMARPAFGVLMVMTLLVGIVYPLAMTAVGKVFFPSRASGSLLEVDGVVKGSELLGQSFTRPSYFWGRLSATTPTAYNAAASGGSNLGMANPLLVETIRKRVAELMAADPKNKQQIPIDLVTASASGLDPHISMQAAYYQVPRVARARRVSEDAIRELVRKYEISVFKTMVGTPQVHVLKLNMALDETFPLEPTAPRKEKR